MSTTNGLQHNRIRAHQPPPARIPGASGISPLDAWITARLVASLDDGGREPSDAFRPVIEQMLAVPPEDRHAVWMTFLSFRGDSDQIAWAVADADPMAPPPDADATLDIPDEAVTICMSDVERKYIEWLWEPRIPLGMLTMFAGQTKQGKSFATTAIAAAISRGADLPFDPVVRPPASVLILNAEDDLERTLQPRLAAAGADMEKVHVLEAIHRVQEGRKSFPSLTRDIQTIESAVRRLGDCKLIIIDPVTAYMGGVDDHSNIEVRGVLTPLAHMAARTQAAVLLISHTKKGANGSAKDAVLGSQGYGAVCRFNFIFVRDKSDAENRRVLVCDNGCNLVPWVPTLGYTIQDAGEGPFVDWAKETFTINADEAMAALGEDPGAQASRRDAAAWLKDFLAGGPKPSAEVFAAAKEQGFTREVLFKCKGNMNASTTKMGFRNGPWFWSIPEAPDLPENFNLGDDAEI